MLKLFSIKLISNNNILSTQKALKQYDSPIFKYIQRYKNCFN